VPIKVGSLLVGGVVLLALLGVILPSPDKETTQPLTTNVGTDLAQTAAVQASVQTQGPAVPTQQPTAPSTGRPTPTVAPTPTTRPTPTPRPEPTPRGIAAPTFIVDTAQVGCHQDPIADAAVVATFARGTIQALDMIFDRPDGTWHREVDRQCWIRTKPAPVETFSQLAQAERYAARYTPVVLTGRGQTATRAITLPLAVSTATFTHDGSRNFIVKTFQGRTEDLLINRIGRYQGVRPLFGDEPITFDIQADGNWTITIKAIESADSASFSGSGDAVSGSFNPPTSGAWEFTHNGTRNFIVKAYCGGGESLVQNSIGRVEGSRIVQFGRGPCIWEVEADGAWSMTSR